MTSLQRIGPFALGLALQVASAAVPVHAAAVDANAVLWVTQLRDSGPGSLRAALATANARAGLDHIRFAPDLAGTLPVSGGPLMIRDALRIDGTRRQRIRLRGNAVDSLFEVTADAVEVSLRDLVLTDAGSSAIVNRGATLIVEDCTLRGNRGRRGGGIDSQGGWLSLNRTTIRDNLAEALGDDDGRGGGIHAIDTTIRLEASRISSNHADALGGGLYVEIADPDVLFVRGSLIDSNIAATQGGGAFVHARDRTISGFINSTLSGNRSARDAALWFDGGLVINSSTISDNISLPAETAGICAGLCGAGDRTELWLNSTLMSGNRDVHGNGHDLSAMAGPVHVAHSLIERIADGAIDDGRGHNLLNVAARLGPLARQGGMLPVHALAADSPAIDAGSNPSLLQHDQRGPCHARVVGAAPDIGAHEHDGTSEATERPDRRRRCLPSRPR